MTKSKGADLRALRDIIVTNCAALLADPTLTERQRQRLDEIHRASRNLSQAIDEYYGRVNGYDPRYRLMYAVRTPLAMIHLATYLLGVYHERNTEPFTTQQRACIRSIDESGRRIVIEVERLWAEMLAERDQV